MVNLKIAELIGKDKINKANGNKTRIKDITDELINGIYHSYSTYTIFYLYDIDEDYESFEFIKEYGSKLHNRSSNIITILTYYSEDMTENWKNLCNKNFVNPDKSNGFEVKEMIEKISAKYKVKSLPALVIVKKEDNIEKYFQISFAGYNSLTMYNSFIKIMDIIMDNYEEKMIVIKDKLKGYESDKELYEEKIITEDVIEKLIQLETKTNGIRCTKEEFAKQFGITRRQLQNLINSNSFDRDRCLYLGIKYNMKEDELNKFLRSNNNFYLLYDERDGIIRRCLQEKYSIEKVQALLEENNYPKLNYKKAL